MILQHNPGLIVRM